MQASDQLLFRKLELLGLALVLVDQLLLVVDLFSALALRISKFLRLESFHGALALCNHLPDGFSLHVLGIKILMVILLLSQLVFFELLLHGLCTLQLANIHVVTRILNVLTALLLALKRLKAALSFALFAILGLQLLLSSTQTKAISSSSIIKKQARL